MAPVRDLLGQTHLLDRLGERVASGAVSHAYLISGPRSIGKRTLAQRIAQTLVCERGRSPGGCGACRACLKVEHGTHPDVREVAMLEDRQFISIEQIRDLERDLSLRPIESSWRVVIVHDASDLSEDAQDSLLKTLEEPPSHAVLLLVTYAPARLLDTISSRCQPLALRPVRTRDLEDFIAARTGDPALARIVAPLAGGRPGLALRLATDERERASRLAILDELFTLLGSGLTARFGWARRVTEGADSREAREELRGSLEERFGLWLELLRDAAVAGGAPPLHPDQRERTAALGARVDRRRLAGLASLLVRLRDDLERNANFRAATELLMLRLPYVVKSEQAA